MFLVQSRSQVSKTADENEWFRSRQIFTAKSCSIESLHLSLNLLLEHTDSFIFGQSILPSRQNKLYMWAVEYLGSQQSCMIHSYLQLWCRWLQLNWSYRAHEKWLVHCLHHVNYSSPSLNLFHSHNCSIMLLTKSDYKQCTSTWSQITP